MSNIRVNDFPSRKQYTYAGGTPVFVVDWPFFANTDLFVYLSNPANNFEQEDPINILTLGVDYQVTGAGLHTGGTVTLTVSPTVGYMVTVVGKMPIDRFSIYNTSSVLSMAQLNEDFNRLVVMLKNIDTIMEELIPKYDRSEVVNIIRSLPNTPFSYVNLPLLQTGEVWTGNATNTGLSKMFVGGSGSGNVLSSGPGMRPSLTRWTGTDFVVTDSEVNLPNGSAIYEPTLGTTQDRTGFSDDWGAMHWPAHVTGGRPASPENGDTYYDTTFQQFFGYQNGMWQPFSMGAGTATLWQRIFTQPGHNFEPGDLVYQKDDGDFELLLDTDAVHAEIQGMIVDPDPANPDEFLLQYAGEVDFGAWTSPVPGWATAMPYGGVFFASAVAGEGSLVPPTNNGFINLPVLLANGPTVGVLRPSRGIIIGGTPPTTSEDAPPNTVIIDIHQPGHGFSKNDWLYALPYDTVNGNVEYALGDSSTLATSHVVGVVYQVIDADNFQIQEGGYNINTVNTANNAPGSAITSGGVFYLSNTVPGKLMSSPPVTIGHYAVRCFECEQLATDNPGTSIDAGWIKDMRPIVIASGGGGSNAWSLITTYTINNGDTVIDLTNVLDGSWTDVQFIGRNIVGRRTSPDNTPFINGLSYQVSTDGATPETGLQYKPQTGSIYCINPGGYADPCPGGGIKGGGFCESIPIIINNSQLYSYTDANHGFDFEINISQVNDNTFYKKIMQKSIGYKDTNYANTSNGASLTWFYYAGSTDPITGIYIFFGAINVLPFGSTFELISGEISVYGRVA